MARSEAALARRARAGSLAGITALTLTLALALLEPHACAAEAPGAAPLAQAEQVRLLCGFETPQEAALFDLTKAQISDLHATQGGHSLRVASGGYLSSWRLPADWSGWDTLELDAFVDARAPLKATLLVADQAWQEHGRSYWDRHNREITLRPGANTIRLPVHGLWRGEAGSRGNGLRQAIDPARIIRFDLGVGAGDPDAAVYLDNLRLARGTRPAGLLAFAFGPPDAAVGDGFAPISWNTLHGDHGAAYGLAHACINPNRARSDTFPTSLYESYVWFEEDGNAFVADVPNGRWHAWVMFDDCGYWGGEQARFQRRTILANGAAADQEDRPLGAGDYLFRFEHVEPLPGTTLWDLYVAPLFTPRRIAVEVADGRIRLQMHADAPWSTKVAAIVLYPDAQRLAAERWLAGVEAANRAEFEARAVCVDPGRAPSPPASARAQGWWLGYPAIAEGVAADGPPGAEQGTLSGAGVAGEPLAITVALRPLRDLGSARLGLSELRSQGGAIPASACELRFAQYQARRASSDLSYAIASNPLPLADGSGLRLAPGCTRAFWIIIDIPEGAAPGRYNGTLSIAGDALALALPVEVSVHPFTLAVPDFPMGFLGSWIPAELPEARRARAWSELFRRLAHAGMTSISGGPSIRLAGFAADGTPQLEFAACDAFFAALGAAGLRGPVYDYGGPARIQGLCDGGTIGETGQRWCAQLGVDFPTVVRRVLGAVRAHAPQAAWPRVYRALFDEPRTLDGARADLDLARAWTRGAPDDLLGGFYSVDWTATDPMAATMRQLFDTVAWSGLNDHGQADLDHARATGREAHIYNQGLSRYSFGEYQWAERSKGVRGRMEWNVLALHGWQFFDLDGREPDTGVINWGSREIIPTIDLVRASAGAWDFRYAWNLWRRARAHPELPAAAEATAFLDSIDQAIPAGARSRPAGVPDDEAFRRRLVQLLSALPSTP